MEFMPILELIQRIRKGTIESLDTKSNSVVETDFTSFLLDLTKKKIIEHEQEKYPAPIYNYTRTLVAVKGKGKTVVTHIRYNGLPLDSTDAAIIQRNSLRVRKLSIIGGILNALHFSKELEIGYLGLDKTAQAGLAELLSEVLNEEISPLITNESIDDFIKGLIEKIKGKTALNQQELIRQIRTAERYFVAEYKVNQVLISETSMSDGKVLIQVNDYFGNVLTEDQKKEFRRIHSEQDNSKPAWFILLSEWEKKWLLSIVPKTLDEDWSNFDTISQSSAMSHIPGIQNARMNSLILFDGQDYTLLSRSFNTATMVPYEMHVTKKELPTHIEQTAIQVLAHLSLQVQEDFKNAWEGIPMDNFRPLIMVQSLLSDMLVAKADTRLATEQKKIIQKISMRTIFPEVEIVAGNDPMNFLRHVTALSGVVSKAFGRWSHTMQVLTYAERFINHLEKQKSLKDEQRSRLTRMKNARDELIKLRDEKYKSQGGERNFIAYKAAYTSILVEAMGGIVSTNCKSGKDRTGLQELYKNAMVAYFYRYNTLPKFDDKDLARQNFCELFVLLFNSMMTQEAASANTPGSFGLKLDPTMICSDIRSQLGGSYSLSSSLAGLNKPAKFLENEVRSVRIRKSSVSLFNKQKSQSPYKQLEQEVTEFIQSNPIALKIPAVIAFQEGISECQKKPDLLYPELLTEWRYHFEDLKDNVHEVILLKQELAQLGEEIQGFCSSQGLSGKTLNTDQKTLARHMDFLSTFIKFSDDLFLKSNDLMSTVQQVRYQTFRKMREGFDSVKADFLRKQEEAIKASPSHEAKANIAGNPNTQFSSSSPGKDLASLIAHFDKLSSNEGKPVISPNVASVEKKDTKPK